MRSDNDMKNYWGEYSKFGQHEQVTKNLTLNQNEIITIKTSLIDQLFSGNDYKLYRTSCLSSSTKILDVTMMGNRVRETGNRERVTGNGKMENGKKTENIDRAAVPSSWPGFSPTRPYGLSMPVVRTVGGAGGRTVTWLPKFLGWVVYHIFLDIGLRSRARGVPLLHTLPKQNKGKCTMGKLMIKDEKKKCHFTPFLFL